MKKLFTFLFALLTVVSANAYYLRGDFNSWEATTEMTDNGDGTYSVALESLSGEFKVDQDGDWTNNWGTNGASIVLNMPYTCSVNANNIMFVDAAAVYNNVVVTFMPATATLVVSNQAKATFESFVWRNANPATVFGDIFTSHSEGVTLVTDQTAWKGNLGGHYYVVSGGGTEWSATGLTNYVGISATNKIDSIAILWAPNGTDASNIAWIGWENGVEPNAEVGANHGVGESYTATKSWDDAIWQTFDFSDRELTTVYFSRQWKKAKEGGSVLANFGNNKTINFLGFKVWVSNQAQVAKYTVSYYDGEALLGTESVKEGETPTKASNYETKAHATFAGWYNDAALTSAADFTAAITADKSFYGKWTAEAFTASSSVNIEQLVLDYSKAYDIAGALTAAHITYANIDALDSLNAGKDNNNEPFLGLKLKTAGAYVEMGLNVGDVLRVKFGNVAADVKINGTVVDKATLAAPYEYTAAAQEFVRIETTTGGTVVLKQIMINEPIAEVTLPGEPIVEPEFAEVLLMGSFNDWQGTAFSTEDGETYNAVLDLEPETYALKVKIGDAWYGNGGTMTRDNCTGWVMETAIADNCGLTADIAGSYTFHFTLSDKKLSVIYPELSKDTVVDVPGDTIIEEPEVTKVLLMGSFNEWQGAEFTSEDEESYSVAVNLEPETYALKVKIGEDWYGNGGTMTRDNCSGWVMETAIESNCGLTADVAGTYTFRFTMSDKKLSVIYPELPDVPEQPEDTTTDVSASLVAPYETTIPADFVMPDWLTGCSASLNYTGGDAAVSGSDVIRFNATDTVRMYIESCDSVILDLSATGSRTVAIAVDGVELANSGKFSKNTLVTLGAYVHSASPVVVNVYAVNVTGGTTISRIKVTKYTAGSSDTIPSDEPVAKEVLLKGSFNEWQGTAFTTEDDELYSVAVELADTTYELKVNIGDDWYGNAGTMTRDNCTGWVMETAIESNCGLVADVAGTYTFQFTMSDKKLSVIYPELPKDTTVTPSDTTIVDPVAPEVLLQGSFNEWQGTAFTTEDDELYSVVVELADTTYELKVNIGEDWYGNTGTMTRDNCTGWVMETAIESNCGLVADVAGTYTFQFTMSDKKLSVIYPELPKDTTVIPSDTTIVDPVASEILLQGSFNEWQGTAFTTEDDELYSVAVELADTTYELKVNIGDDWYGNTGTMTRDNCTGWVMETAIESNCGLVADVAGTYTFQFTMSDKKLSVIYPELPKDTTVTPSDTTIVEPDPTIPSTAVLNSYKAEDANVVVAFHTTAPVCNDIVFTGSYNRWSSNPDACVKFEAVDGFEGWYVSSFADASASIEGKPVQLRSDGTFSWEFQVGDDVELISGTLTIEPGYVGEVNLKNYGTDAPVVFSFSKWKEGNSPCVPIIKHNYHVILDAPQCGDYAPAIIGDFNGWSEGIAMNVREDSRYEYTFEDEESHSFKFKAAGDVDWSNEIQVYDEELSQWINPENIRSGAEETLEFDFSDPAKYRYTLCANIVNPDDSIPGDTTIVEPVAQEVLLKGSFNDWQGVAFTTEDEELYSVAVELAVSTYELKVNIGDAWYGNGGTMTRENCTGWVMETAIESNCGLVTDVAGTYTFHFTMSDKKLSVIYPQLPEPPVEQITIETGVDMDVDCSLAGAGHPELLINMGAGLVADGDCGEEAPLLSDVIFEVQNDTAASIIACENSLKANRLIVRMDIKGEAWYYLCFPYDVPMSDLNVGEGVEFVVRQYDGVVRATNGLGGWSANIPSSATLVAGKGYILMASADTKLQMAVLNPTFTCETIEHQLSYMESALGDVHSSWNMVGNPFPSYYDISHLYFGNGVNAGLHAAIYVYDRQTEDYVVKMLGDDNYILHPFEAFFVQNPSSEAINLNWDAAGRLTSKMASEQHAPLAAPAYENAQSARLFVELAMAAENEQNATTRVVYNENASASYEIQRDAVKMDGNAPLRLYTLDADIRYAINERPAGDINLGYRVRRAGEYTLSAQRMDASVLLYDNLMGTIVNMQNGDYTFYSEAGVHESRFTIRRAPQVVTDFESVQDSYQDEIVSIYSVLGQLLYSNVRVSDIHLSAGTYVIQSENNIDKFIIQ